MSRGLGLFILLVGILASGCRTQAGDPAESRPGGTGTAGGPMDRVEGVVRVVGSAPVDVHVVIETPDGSLVRVTGPLREEISRLSGALVRLVGREDPSEVPVTRRQVRAAEYEIVSINGEPVLEGTVEGKSAGWTILRTREGEQVYLASAPDEIKTGQRVWVQGPRSVIVQSYGVMRDE